MDKAGSLGSILTKCGQLVLGDPYSRSLGRAEKKVEAIRVANEPHESSDASKLADAKLEWSIAECRLKVDIDGPMVNG